MNKYIAGIDYGTDSCRALVVNSTTGKDEASYTAFYPRWRKGLYCDPAQNRYRQHPQDYIDSLEEAIHGVLRQMKPAEIDNIVALGIDTTGSTPCLTDRNGIPLALLPGYEEDPDAMFVLWKDHTGDTSGRDPHRRVVREARIASEHRRGGRDYRCACRSRRCRHHGQQYGEGVIIGITLGTTPAQLFKSLVEATAFGSRAILEHLSQEGVRVDEMIGVGGISLKSPYAMQTLADVMGVPIKVAATQQAGALGAAMCAAVSVLILSISKENPFFRITTA